jgi:spore germination cell wall hydrolase CwlJ-like protein
MNRAASGKFPGTLCGVVKQKSQFSFVRGGHIPAAPKASAAWRKAVAISQIAMQDLAESAGTKAMFFHAARVSPNWRGRSRLGTIGNHVFYR